MADDSGMREVHSHDGVDCGEVHHMIDVGTAKVAIILTEDNKSIVRIATTPYLTMTFIRDMTVKIEQEFDKAEQAARARNAATAQEN